MGGGVNKDSQGVKKNNGKKNGGGLNVWRRRGVASKREGKHVSGNNQNSRRE